MYCKQCGHRSEDKTETCQKCGAKLTAETAEYTAEAPRKIRWQTLLAAAAIGLVAFMIVPRIFFRPEFETIGPTDKLRFLRALERSEYKRVGQHDFRLEGGMLVVVWDLRWKVLPEKKQRDIVRIVGHAWEVVGGDETQFRIEGDDEPVATYTKGAVQ